MYVADDLVAVAVMLARRTIKPVDLRVELRLDGNDQFFCVAHPPDWPLTGLKPQPASA